MGKSLIQQQLYQKESKGLFLSSDGSDVSAVSPRLDQRFVQKYLHPICTYSIPNELKRSGERDKKQYPNLFTMIQPETGDLVVGQASFIPAENMKQKSSYLVHNFIVPAARKEEWIEKPSQIFQIDSFIDLPDTETRSEVLEEKEQISYRTENIFMRKQELFHVLQMEEEKFKQLLYASIVAVESNKRIYITFQSALEDQKKYAMWLLELLYTYLPYETRRNIGVTTFHNEPIVKENIHIMFVEPGSIRLRNRAVEEQFVFDFSTHKQSGINVDVNQLEFLNYAYSALQTASDLGEFFIYCERALKGLPKQKKLEMETYNELFLLFYLEKLDYYYYDLDKVAIIKTLHTYLESNHREKEELVQLFSKLLQREERMKDATTVLDYLWHVLEIQRIVGQVNVLEFVVKTIVYYEGEAICKEIWDLLEGYAETYHQVLSYIGDIFSYGEIIDEYLKQKFSLHHDLDTILHNINTLLSANPSLEHNVFFLKWTKNRLVNEVKKSSKPMTIVAKMDQFFHQSILFHSYKRSVLPEVKGHLLIQVQLERITMEEVQHFAALFLREKDDNNFAIKGWEKEKYEILEVLHSFFYSPIEQVSALFRMVTMPIKGKASELALELMKENGLFQPYERFLLLFPGGMEGVEHRQVFSYLAIYGTAEEMTTYIKWSYKQFATNSRYNHALLDYLVSDRNSVWKKKEIQKELKKVRSQSFRKLLKKVREQTSSPTVRFVRKYGIVLCIFLIVLAGGYFYLNM